MRPGSNEDKSRNEYYKREYILRKLRAIEYLGGKCQSCGYDKYYGALEFHHKDPTTKEMSWTKLRCRPWEKQKAELDKCELLCANCHREAHIDEEVLEKALEWKEHCDKYHERIRIKERKCKQCGSIFNPDQSRILFCSPECSQKNQQKVDWPDNLPELVEKSSKRAVAKQLGVSDKAVAKRLKNHHMWV